MPADTWQAFPPFIRTTVGNEDDGESERASLFGVESALSELKYQ